MNVSLVLIILGIGILATYFSGDKHASKIALFFSLASLGCTVSLLQHFHLGENINYISAWIAKPNISFALLGDGLSLAMLLLTNTLTALIIYSTSNKKYKNARVLYSLILLMSLAMDGSFLASDGILYYIFWELSLLPIYFIALIWGNGYFEKRRKIVFKFFIYTLAGSLFMLVAFVYLYLQAGSFLLEDLYKLQLSYSEQLFVFLAFFIAYAIKIPFIPFHTWQANVYQKAPSIGTMLLSGLMLKMGLYSVLRWQLPIAPSPAKEYSYIFIGMGIIAVIYGSIIALRQKDIKRLLAYSSFAHVGLIVAGIYTLTIDGFIGAVLQLISHGFVIVGLFFIAEIIFRRYRTRLFVKMGGIRSQAPVFTSLFLLLVLASVALPSTLSFVGEFMLLYSLAQTELWFAILGGSTIILGAYYMLKMFQTVMLGETNPIPFKEITFNEGFALVLIVGVVFFFGLYPKPIIDLITPSLENILTHINRIN